MATLKQNSEALRAITDKLKSLPKKNELVELEVTENGEYNPPENADGFSKVTVATENRLAQYLNKELVNVNADDFGGLSVIPSSFFSGHSALKSATLGPSIKTISQSSFYNCSALEQVVFPETLTTIAASAFYGCKALKEVNLKNVTSIDRQAFKSSGVSGSLTISEKVTYIGDYAFELTSLESVVISSTTTARLLRGLSVFANTPLKTVSLPDSLTEIGSQFFMNTELEEVKLPDSITAMGSAVFRDCKKLKRANIPLGVTVFPRQTFMNSAIETYVMPNHIVRMENVGGETWTFYGCKSLSEFVFSENCTNVANQCFEGCTALKRIVLPASVSEIGIYAFQNSGIETIVMKPTTPPTLAVYVFQNANSLKEILVPIGSGDAYKSATNWSTYASIIVESEEAGGADTGNWLFQNEQVDSSGNNSLPAPVIGNSYTLFVDGEEIATSRAESSWDGSAVLRFNTEDYRIYFIYDASTGMGWHFHPMDSQVQSGSVSIRININGGGTND